MLNRIASKMSLYRDKGIGLHAKEHALMEIASSRYNLVTRLGVDAPPRGQPAPRSGGAAAVKYAPRRNLAARRELTWSRMRGRSTHLSLSTMCARDAEEVIAANIQGFTHWMLIKTQCETNIIRTPFNIGAEDCKGARAPATPSRMNLRLIVGALQATTRAGRRAHYLMFYLIPLLPKGVIGWNILPFPPVLASKAYDTGSRMRKVLLATMGDEDLGACCDPYPITAGFRKRKGGAAPERMQAAGTT